jgi:hypothetical protein
MACSDFYLDCGRRVDLVIEALENAYNSPALVADNSAIARLFFR